MRDCFSEYMIDKNLNYGRHILEEWLKGIPADTVLDLGGGHGVDLETVRTHHKSAELHAIESNIHYSNYLRERDIVVHNINLENTELPFDDHSVDLIIANQILEHTKEIFWIFHEATRVLKVGGYFYIGLPNLASLHNRLLLLLGKQPTSIQNSTAHVRGYTKSDFVKFLEICWLQGYSIQEFAGSNFYPLPGLLARVAALLMPNAAVSIFLLIRKEKEYTDAFIQHPRDLETNFYLGQDIHHVVTGMTKQA